MNRCRICDAMYQPNWSEPYLDEGYCPVCAGEISLCLEELEDFEEPQTCGWEEVEDEDGYQ